MSVFLLCEEGGCEFCVWMGGWELGFSVGGCVCVCVCVCLLCVCVCVRLLCVCVCVGVYSCDRGGGGVCLMLRGGRVCDVVWDCCLYVDVHHACWTSVPPSFSASHVSIAGSLL